MVGLAGLVAFAVDLRAALRAKQHRDNARISGAQVWSALTKTLRLPEYRQLRAGEFRPGVLHGRLRSRKDVGNQSAARSLGPGTGHGSLHGLWGADGCGLDEHT